MKVGIRLWKTRYLQSWLQVSSRLAVSRPVCRSALSVCIKHAPYEFLSMKLLARNGGGFAMLSLTALLRRHHPRTQASAGRVAAAAVV